MSLKTNSPFLGAISMLAVMLAPNLARSAENFGAAPEKVCCVCTTGDKPSWQVPIFKLGCKHWLGRQSGCNVKQMVSDWDSVEGAASSCKNGKVKLGYIGHGTELMSKTFLYDFISKLTDPKRLSASVDFDNTACSALPDAAKTKRLIDGLPLAPGKYVRIEGAQSISVGEFDHMLPGLWQVNATVDTRKEKPEYPPCSSVRNANCLTVQEYNQVYCENEDHSYAVLTCQKAPDPRPIGSGDDVVKQDSLRWIQTKTVSAEELLAIPDSHLATGTYECTQMGKTTRARITFRESLRGESLVEINAPISSATEYGIILNTDRQFSKYSLIGSSQGIITVNTATENSSPANFVVQRKPKYVFEAYSECKKVDSPQSQTNPCTTHDVTPLAPEQSSTLKTVESVLTSQKR